jgi:hypothetical protein
MATVKVIPGKLNYVMTRGDDFAAQLTIQEGDPLAPVDVSTRTYTAQIRATADSTTVIATFTVDMTDAATGIVVLRLADTVTDDLGGVYVWDLQQDTGGVIRTLVGGTFSVIDDVTRAA